MQQAPAAICAQGSAPLADPNELACTFNSKSRPSRTFLLKWDSPHSLLIRLKKTESRAGTNPGVGAMAAPESGEDRLFSLEGR